jgi:hypothetical protein
MIFLENGDYTTGNGDPATLWEHLDDLREWGGTPDVFETHADKNAAKRAAQSAGAAAIVVDELSDYRPVYRSRPGATEDPVTSARNVVTLAASEKDPDQAISLVQSRLGVTTGDVAGAVLSELDDPAEDWAALDHVAREDLLEHYIDAEVAHLEKDTPSP